MKTERIALALTVINLVILGHSAVRVASAAPQAAPQQEPQVLRGRGLEIVDDRGRRRAQIILMPASTMPDGTKYAETVLFRLIDPNGRPGVKIGTSSDGSGISLAGDSEHRDWNGVQILAGDSAALVKLTNKDGKQQVLRP